MGPRFRLIAGRPISAGPAANDEPPRDGIWLFQRMLATAIVGMLLAAALALVLFIAGLR